MSAGVPMYYMTARMRDATPAAEGEGLRATFRCKQTRQCGLTAAAWSHFRDDVKRLLGKDVHAGPASRAGDAEERRGMLEAVEMSER